jgi:hypothetical protein
VNILDQDIPASAAEQARLDLSMAAAGSERANRPRALLMGAGLLLVVAVIYALSGVAARAAAMGRVAAARQQTSKVQDLTGELTELKNRLGSRGVDYSAQTPVLLSQLATSSNVEPSTAITEGPPRESGPSMQQRVYTAHFVDKDPANLLTFLNQTQASPLTAGIEINRIQVVPGTADETGQVRWKMDVDFTRWERRR